MGLYLTNKTIRIECEITVETEDASKAMRMVFDKDKQTSWEFNVTFDKAGGLEWRVG